ncbi:hypothetical protein PG995_011447 [Apiospora arundinis]
MSNNRPPLKSDDISGFATNKEKPSGQQSSSTEHRGSAPQGGNLFSSGSSGLDLGSSKKRKVNDPGDDQDQGGEERGIKRAKPASLDNGPRKLLACPFWKSDARRYRECFKLKLDGIPRVKQHISRSHYHENHCEKCKAVFAESIQLQAHLEHEQCQWRGLEVLEGITHQQRSSLTKKSKTQHSESERWFAIWKLIFPGRQSPSSAYMDPELSEDLSEFRLYSQVHGMRILMEELEREGLAEQLESSEEIQSLICVALGRGQDLVFDTWLANRASSFGTPASPTQNASSTNNQECGISEQSVADSGVAVGSHQESGIIPFQSSTDNSRITSFGELNEDTDAPGEVPAGTRNQGDPVLATSNSDLTNGLTQPLQPWLNTINEMSWPQMDFEEHMDFGDLSFP